MNAEDLSPLQKIQFLEQKANDCIKLFDHVRHMAQTVHQAYHQDQPETFLVCPKALCRDTARILFEVTKPYEHGIGFKKS